MHLFLRFPTESDRIAAGTPRLRLRTAAVLAAALVAAAAAPVTVAAATDETTRLDRLLGDVSGLIRAGRYTDALEDLSYIAGRIQELRLREAAPLFPPAPDGWSAGEAIRTSGEEGGWSRRLEARRLYRPREGTGRIEVRFDLNSPLIPRIALTLDPLYLDGSPQARIVEIAGDKARVEYNPDTREGSLRLVTGTRVLVSIEGKGIDSAALIEKLAGRIDYTALIALSRR